MPTAPSDLNADMTMAEVLERFPGAQRALFQKFHIGGCSSCGFQPEDKLGEVLAKHRVKDPGVAIDTIKQFAELDRKMQVQPEEVASMLKNGKAPRLIDVRSAQEYDIARIEGGELLTQELFDELRAEPQDTALVFYCHHGIRSLDAATYFVGHGFTNVRSMAGGIDAWAERVDTSVARY